MRIKSIKTRLFEKALDGSVRNAKHRWTVKRSLLVFVETDTGLIGVGETWVDAGDPASLVAFIERDLAPALIGESALTPEQHFKRAIDLGTVSVRRSQTWAGMSAIDIALWDIKAQAAGEPLWRLLGGGDPRVEPYASAGLYKEGQSIAAFAEEYATYIHRGFKAVKIKVGGASLAIDTERVSALRRAIGPDAKLMVDAVSNFDVPRAMAFARAVAGSNLYWLEQPLPVEDVDGLARLSRDCAIPLCGLENEYGLWSYRRLLERDAVHYVQFDPIISGGITFGRKIAALAEAWFKPVTLHNSNSIVSMLASLHLAAAVPNANSIEFHVFHQPLFDRAPKGTLDLHDGCLVAPGRPGLGIDAKALLV